MSTRSKITRPASVFFLGLVVLCLVVECLANPSFATTTTTHSQHKAKKAPPPPPLPSGPTGPIQQIPLDSMAPVAPQVTYTNGQLTIIAPNSTLGDILRAVHKQTGAEIEIPVATDRVVTHLGPGPARQVMADLLNGSRFNYVLLGSPENSSLLTRVVLVAKSGGEVVNPNAPPGHPTAVTAVQAGPPAPDAAADDADAATEDAAADDTTDQPVEAEQPVTPGDPNAVKTPQQMLQEMQQRQMQLQQQQQQQPPLIPGARPPQEQ